MPPRGTKNRPPSGFHSLGEDEARDAGSRSFVVPVRYVALRLEFRETALSLVRDVTEDSRGPGDWGMKTHLLKPRGSIPYSLKPLTNFNKRIYMFVGLVLLAVVAITTVKSRRYPKDHCQAEELNLVQQEFKVPNIVHFERRGKEASQMTVSDAACVRAALRHQGPVWIHTDNPTGTEEALKQHGLLGRVTLTEIPNSGKSEPESLLRSFSGIFLKNDIYLLRNLNVLRTEDYSATPGRDIVAVSKVDEPKNLRLKTISDVLLDKDWGALYIFDVLKNCSVKAVRLGTRNTMHNHIRRRN